MTWGMSTSYNSSYNTSHSNMTAHNSTDELPGPPYTDETKRAAMIAMYSVILFLSLVGNSIIIGIVLRSQRMRTTANFLILNMALSDALAAVVVLPRMLDIHITRSWAYKLSNLTLVEVFCKICPLTRELSSAVSVLSIVAIGIDRFYAIVFPMRAKPRSLSLKVVIPAIWLFAAAAYSPAVYTYRAVRRAGLLYCAYSWAPAHEERSEKWFLAATGVVFVAIPLCVLAVLYTLIAIKMKNRSIPGGASAPSALKTRQRKNRNIIQLSMAIVVSFFVCWVPYTALLLLVALKWDFKPPRDSDYAVYVMQEVFTALTYISLAVNPVICLVFSTNFRQGFREVFLCSKMDHARVPIPGATAINALQSTGATSLESISVNSAAMGYINQAMQMEGRAFIPAGN